MGGPPALQLGERVVDKTRCFDIIKRVLLLELSIAGGRGQGHNCKQINCKESGFHSRVTGGVQMVLVGNLGEVLRGGAIPGHVLPPSIAKHLRSDGSSGNAKRLLHHFNVVVHRVGTVSVLRVEQGRGKGWGRARGVHFLTKGYLTVAPHHLFASHLGSQ